MPALASRFSTEMDLEVVNITCACVLFQVSRSGYQSCHDPLRSARGSQSSRPSESHICSVRIRTRI
ncbi:hypothetical protein N657DRAFT_642187 [Parathielavia appendiculata]|uniref:Uncharacterized protein n=1 Tax=Parathielavia appendiculata TaxID=2587402 RepID=A0AAN6U5H8_9PEZI|nr:hypothetical protein N657DRAFT_642187 [Parathielavia appendiculata]